MCDTRAGLWLLILTALGAVGGAVGQALGAAEPDQNAAGVFFSATGGASILLPIVGVLLVTSEFSQRTGLVTFALVPVRGRIVLAKFVAALGVAVAISAVCLLLGLLGGSLLGSGSEIDGAQVAHGLLYLVIGVAIGVTLGLLLQASPLAIVTIFAAPILFGAVGAISDRFQDVTRWLDQSALMPLIDLHPGNELDWDRIAVTVLFWVALPLALGMIRLERGDID
jgi:ABC-type transport system involved in multi-copper enzyme maturation permease subunit